MKRDGSLAFHRAAFLCSVLALAIAAPAIAEDAQNPENPGVSKQGKNPRAQVLEEYDTDGDGRLSKEERSAAREKRRAQRLEKFDADGDGKLSPAEEQAARMQRRPRDPNPFDADGDGKLSDEERQAARDQRAKQKAQMLEEFDANGDGKLTGDEKEQARSSRLKKGNRLGIGPNARPRLNPPSDDPGEP